jgi:hypothetical protein
MPAFAPLIALPQQVRPWVDFTEAATNGMSATLRLTGVAIAGRYQSTAL